MRRVGACVSLVVLFACDNASAPTTRAADASIASPGDASPPDSDDSTDDGPAFVVGDEPQALLGPDPPKTACVPDGDLSGCPILLDVCAGSLVLVDYHASSCVGGWCRYQKQNLDCALVHGTCGPAPLDAGEGDAQVRFTSLGPPGGSGCIIPAPAAPLAPSVACDEDASSDAAPCTPPPSVCADGPDLHWLVYYDNGHCVAGQCVWQTVRHYCNRGCDNGVCPSAITPPAPPASP